MDRQIFTIPMDPRVLHFLYTCSRATKISLSNLITPSTIKSLHRHQHPNSYLTRWAFTPSPTPPHLPNILKSLKNNMYSDLQKQLQDVYRLLFRTQDIIIHKKSLICVKCRWPKSERVAYYAGLKQVAEARFAHYRIWLLEGVFGSNILGRLVVKTHNSYTVGLGQSNLIFNKVSIFGLFKKDKI